MNADPPAWHSAWHHALDELEIDLVRAETLLRSADLVDVTAAPSTGWTPPTTLGPLPAGLLRRAQSLHERQLQVSARIAEALAHNRVQSAVAARLETGGPGPSTALYVDRAC